MQYRKALIEFLEHKALLLRLHSLAMTGAAQSGHLTSCLSAADLVAALFFYGMRFDPDAYDNPNNDRFILSKGHAAPLLYAAWHELGKVSYDELVRYRSFQSPLEGHPTARFTYTEGATGSLGIGLSIGAGMALAARMRNSPAFTYVLLGDAELAEGSVWEAAEIASYYKLHSLVALVDGNRLGQSTESLHGHDLACYAHKFQAFGWATAVVNGHDMHEIMSALDEVNTPRSKPYIILAKTYKGHGVAQLEDKAGHHGVPLVGQENEQARAELKKLPAYALSSYAWSPQPHVSSAPLHLWKMCSFTLPVPAYEKGQQLATRRAYGQGLTTLGALSERVIALDAEVKNSTYAELFEQKYPERFIQCFVAEQNMVSMGVGLNKRGYIPFISTFAAFFTRAHDQIRMAALGGAAVRLAGSHAGVSIGYDGPSQMGLEDIALMRAVPGSVVFYPSDAVSTYKLLEVMANYHTGISYLRTTRMATPVIYDINETFSLGGCNIVRTAEHPRACIIAAGVTLFEALKAHDLLLGEHIPTLVIDLYCVQPLDGATLAVAARQAQGRVITVEDHYRAGGIGEAIALALQGTGVTVRSLCVEQLPRSGSPEELMEYAHIDAAAIVAAVKAV